MSDPTDRYYLARLQPQAIETTTPNQLTEQPQSSPQPIEEIQIVQRSAGQTTDPRLSHYIPVKHRDNPPPPLPTLQLPNLLNLTLSVTVALLLLVAASMFSISLTAYSNSVDRIDRSRSFLHVE